MPSRSQKGRSMGESFDQQEAQRPADSPTTSRQAGQSGGSATSSASRSGARNARTTRLSADGWRSSTVAGEDMALRYRAKEQYSSVVVQKSPRSLRRVSQGTSEPKPHWNH
jgi:hypothetical protein